MRTLLYEAANVVLTRYKGQLKLKDWAFAIARRSTIRKARIALAGRLPIILHAHAPGRNRVSKRRRHHSDRGPHSAPARSDSRGREQTTARIV
jgi:hypothetical protein